MMTLDPRNIFDGVTLEIKSDSLGKVTIYFVRFLFIHHRLGKRNRGNI
jgi:hypothetical protein